MDNGLAHFFFNNGVDIKQLFFPNVEAECILLCLRGLLSPFGRNESLRENRALFPPQAALEMGSFHPGWERGSPKTGSDREQGSLGGTVGPDTSVFSFHLLHVSLLYELKNTSELKQNASWGFKQRELAFKSFIIQKQ